MRIISLLFFVLVFSIAALAITNRKMQLPSLIATFLWLIYEFVIYIAFKQDNLLLIVLIGIIAFRIIWEITKNKTK